MLFSVLFLACNSSKNLVKVQNINDIKKIYPNNLIYSLPKTKIVIVVEIEKIIKNKGPYGKFTDKYLGALNKTIKKNETFWEISKVKFFSYPIVDTSKTFIVGTKNNYSSFPLTLSKEGFPIAYNIAKTKYDHTNEINLNNSAINNNKSKKLSSNFISSNKNYKIVYDTVYKEEVYDTIIRKVPILKPNLVIKTTEEQAKELADRLTILRDDRAALLVGEADNENLPRGDALKIMLNEIDKLEAEYLSMFIGRTDTLRYTYSFSYIPSKNDINIRKTLFKFSESSGILPSENIYGTPVHFEIDVKNYSKNLKKYQSDIELYKKMDKKNNSGFCYRIPKKASVKLIYGSQVISEKNIFISQLGIIQYLPSEIFENKNLKIEFYPNLGSIKSINYQ